MPNRRQLLQWISAHTLLSSLGGSLSAMDLKNGATQSRVNELLTILVASHRDKIPELLVNKIKQGLTHQDLLTALTLAGVYHVEPYPTVGFKYHTVMMLSAVHNIQIHSPHDENWLPLVWAADTFKQAQQSDTFNGDWTLATNPSKQTFNVKKAQRIFKLSMENWDTEASDAAIIQLVKTTPIKHIFEWLFLFGARDFRDIGHKAITVSNSYRLLNLLGAQYAEPILRSTVYALQNHTGEPNPSVSDLSADRPWRLNQEYARSFPQHWQNGKTDSKATMTLLTALRKVPYNNVGSIVLDLLNKNIHPQMLWDAMILSAGELIMRSSGIISVHANTCVNALHYAYKHTYNDTNKRLLLLQGLSFCTLFRDLLKGDIRQLNIDSFEAIPATAKGNERYAEIFENISNNRVIAAAKVLHTLNQGFAADPIITLGRRYAVINNTGYHDYKFTEAAFENASQISPHWKAHYLSASVFYLNGSKDKSNNIVDKTKMLMTE